MSRRAVAGMAAAVSGPGPGPVFTDDFDGELANIGLQDRTGWQQLSGSSVDGLQVRTDGTIKPRRAFPAGQYAPTTPLGQTDYYIETAVIDTRGLGGHLIHYTDIDNFAYVSVDKVSATGTQVVEVVGGAQQPPILAVDGGWTNTINETWRTEVRGTEVRIFRDSIEVTGSPVTLTQTTPTEVAGLLCVNGSATTYQWITDFEYGTL